MDRRGGVPGVRGGYFVEAGAGTGLQGSASHLLEREHDWRGICVEPGDRDHETLWRRRSCATDNRCLAATTADHVEVLTYPDDPPRSGIRALNKNGPWAEQRNAVGETTVEETVTLSDVLEQHSAPPTVHYLCLDVEGAESSILGAYDFAADRRILALSVEGTSCDALLTASGYSRERNRTRRTRSTTTSSTTASSSRAGTCSAPEPREQPELPGPGPTAGRPGHDLTPCQIVVAILPADRLVVGMQLPIQSQSTIYAEPWEATAGAAELAAVAQAADQSGFWYLAVCDHVAIPRELADAMSTTWWDTVATLGWLAGITTSTRLLSHVYVVPYRHPLVVAKAFSTLDVVSGGRVVLGVGAGHVAREFEALGVEFGERGKLLDEGIDAVRRAFAEEFDRPDDGAGAGSGMGQRPRPIQAGGPPIWVGGSSRPALRRAAERGDGWLPQGRVTAEDIAFVRRHRQATHGDAPLDIGALAGAVYVGEPSWDVGRRAVTGPPGKVAEVLATFADLGVGQVQVRFRSRSAGELVDQIRRFGAEVVPQLPGAMASSRTA